MIDTNETELRANTLAIRARITALLGGDFDPWEKDPAPDQQAAPCDL